MLNCMNCHKIESFEPNTYQEKLNQVFTYMCNIKKGDPESVCFNHEIVLNKQDIEILLSEPTIKNVSGCDDEYINSMGITLLPLGFNTLCIDGNHFFGYNKLNTIDIHSMFFGFFDTFDFKITSDGIVSLKFYTIEGTEISDINLHKGQFMVRVVHTNDTPVENITISFTCIKSYPL